MTSLTQYLTPSNIQIVSSIFLMIFTGVLACYTYYLYQETKRNREYQIQLNQPELSVIFEPSKKYINWINIKIKNIGRSPLYDLELEKVNNDFVCFNGKKLSELKYLQKINYLRPDQEIEQFFISLADGKNKPEKIQFSLFFKYKSKNKNKNKNKNINFFRKRFDFDFTQFYDMSQLGEEPLNQIAKDLENIGKNIGYLASGFKKLQVITQTKKEKRKEEKEYIKKIKTRIKKTKK